MRCIECGGTYIEKYDDYTTVYTPDIKIKVNGYKYLKCNQCDNVLLSIDICKAIESEYKKFDRNCIYWRKKLCSNSVAPEPNKSKCLGIKNCDVHKLK